MQINWYGQTCFQIEAKQGKDKIKIITDPFGKDNGLKLPKLKADIVTISHSDYDNKDIGSASEDRKEPLFIEGPGEYESREVYVHGIDAFHDDKKGADLGKITIYTIKAEDMVICHLSNIGQGELEEEQIDIIGEVDILLLPIGGKDSLSSSSAIKIMSQIEPRITIPMYYNIPGLKDKLDSLDLFFKELGIDKIAAEERVKIQKSDLSADKAQIIVLKP
jgi:L-ascorbate metabolism protein UlaG (beta-lactamase superfamily)